MGWKKCPKRALKKKLVKYIQIYTKPALNCCDDDDDDASADSREQALGESQSGHRRI